MGGSKKSKRVNWASDVNLCQVRLFLSEESPSQVGVESQDHLQAKTLWSVNSGGTASDDNSPPGFEGLQPGHLWRNKLSQLPLIKWRCPPRFGVDSTWRVVAGEESKEVEAQNQREMRVLEAIYPRLSSIPPNPAVLPGIGDSFQNDQNTPLIPMTPIEDEDTAPDASLSYTESDVAPMTSQAQLSAHMTSQAQLPAHMTSQAQLPAHMTSQAQLPAHMTSQAQLPAHMTSQAQFPAHMTSQAQLSAHGTSSSQVSGGGTPNPLTHKIPETSVQPNIMAAAQAALTAAMSKNGQGNLIDHDLLIKILSDPKMIEQLVRSQPTTSTTQNVPPNGVQNIRFSTAQNMPSTSMHNLPPISNPPSFTNHRQASPATHITRPEIVSSLGTSGRPFFSPSMAPPVRTNVRPPVQNPVQKDINYYKSLIQQHGAERQDGLSQLSSQQLGANQEPLSYAVKFRDQKSKIMRPCIYFNSARGCRNGVNCAYLHESSAQSRVGGVPEVQSTKRMKMDREITGT